MTQKLQELHHLLGEAFPAVNFTEMPKDSRIQVSPTFCIRVENDALTHMGGYLRDPLQGNIPHLRNHGQTPLFKTHLSPVFVFKTSTWVELSAGLAKAS